MNIQIEIRAGEGGDDAKLLTRIQSSIYTKYAEKAGLIVDVVSESDN